MLSKSILKLTGLVMVLAVVTGCGGSSAEQANTPDDRNQAPSNPAAPTNSSPQNTTNGGSGDKEIFAKLMEMEKRDKEGNVVGQPEEGLWFKRGETEPYTGIVAGHYKGGQIESRREYKDGVQIGEETHWYDSGKKRMEMIYKDGEIISTTLWDLEGNKQGE
tara:strand:- start:4 stop:489 length:486 start_codon:yes stop_codon:yes gene_type:complete